MTPGMPSGRKPFRSLALLLLSLLIAALPLAAASAQDEAVIPEITTRTFAVADNEGMRFVASLRLGLNLGNCFDAIDCTWLSDEMAYESAWCGAKVTPELIDAIRDAGFSTIRIPVSWHNHLSDPETWSISEPWLSRVQEVVDLCLARGLYVIINIHHDNNTSFLYPSTPCLEQSIGYVTAIWRQLSERFAAYDEHLIFESCNEPRLVGHPCEWSLNAGNPDCQDAVACINQINQAFVDTVRAGEGCNPTRYLLCPGYDASAEGALNSGFVLPTDPVQENDHRIILSVHAYTPYSFALDAGGTASWSSANTGDRNNMTGFMDQLFLRFTKLGQPVLISEFGARDKSGNIDARTDFAACYVAEARARGITCIWWDNNAFTGNGELFGLINRKTCETVYPSILQAMTRYAGN